MSENEVKHTINLIKQLKKDISKDSAMASFVGAGILQKDGNFTKTYSNLENLFSETHH